MRADAVTLRRPQTGEMMQCKEPARRRWASRLKFVALLPAAVVFGACAFIPRQVNVNSVEGRIVYPRESYAARHRVSFGSFEDRRASQERLGVGRNKLMMVTTTIGISGDLRGLLERVVRQNFAANGIGDGPSPIMVRGAVLEASSDAVGPDHVYVQVVASLTILDSTTNVPILHRVLRGREVTPVTQVSNAAWEDAFVGALNQISAEIEAIAGLTATALARARGPGSGPEVTPKNAVLLGSGLFVSREGDVLTNNHVVEGCSSAVVKTAAGQSYNAAVVARDGQNDLALLSTLQIAARVATFHVGSRIRPGDSVVVVGYPLHGLLASSASVTTGAVSALAGPHDDTRFLQITAPVQVGNSGGPLLDEKGNVIGVVVAKLDARTVAGLTGDLPENVNFAINASLVRAFLDGHQVAYDTVAADNPRTLSDVGEIARGFTVLVECHPTN